MELGGKNPQIVFADADWEAALDACVFGAYFNAGECCNAGSRLLLQRSIAEDFVAALAERSREVKVGDPLDPATKVGAIVSADASGQDRRPCRRGQAGRSERARGRRTARLERPVHGGDDHRRASRRRWRSRERKCSARSCRALTFDTLDEAMALANDASYGLSASVWSRDLDTVMGVGRQLRAGTVWANTFMDGAPELPFGGYKQSGLGRELGRRAVEDYTEEKTFHVHNGPRTSWWLPRRGGREVRRRPISVPETAPDRIRWERYAFWKGIVMKFRTMLMASAMAASAAGFAASAHAADIKEVQMLHWWTSGGEAAALNVLKQDLAKEGYAWKDVPVAGGGGEGAMTALKAMVAAGNPPTASQILGYFAHRLRGGGQARRHHRRSRRRKAGTRSFPRRCRSSPPPTASGTPFPSTSTRSTGFGSTRR